MNLKMTPTAKMYFVVVLNKLKLHDICNILKDDASRQHVCVPDEFLGSRLGYWSLNRSPVGGGLDIR